VKEFARLPAAPPREAVADDERGDYDAIVERTQRVHGVEGLAGRYFSALLNSPPLGAALVRLGTAVRRGQLRGTYSDAERELMDLVLARELGSNSILPIHIPDALAVGVRPDAVTAIFERREDDLTEDERQLATYARDFVAGAVTDDAYARLRSRFGDRGAVEFTVLLGFLLMTIRLWQALGVPEPTDAEIRELIDDLRAGRTGLPDPTARIG